MSNKYHTEFGGVTVFFENRWRLTVYDGGYMDYGLQILDTTMVESGDPFEPDPWNVEPLTYKEGYKPYNNGFALSWDAHGNDTDDEGHTVKVWNAEDWGEYLNREAESLLEAFVLEQLDD